MGGIEEGWGGTLIAVDKGDGVRYMNWGYV